MPSPQAHAKKCGAKTRRGSKCQQPAMPNGRCRMHGGPTPAGIASPNFKHGRDSRYLKHLPAAWAPHFDLDSKNLVALTEELAVIEARVTAQLERIQGARTITAAMRKELDSLIDRKARLVAVDSRRRKDEHEMIARDDFGQLARAVLMAAFAHVVDADLRGKIQADVLRILQLEEAQTIETVAS